VLVVRPDGRTPREVYASGTPHPFSYHLPGRWLQPAARATRPLPYKVGAGRSSPPLNRAPSSGDRDGTCQGLLPVQYGDGTCKGNHTRLSGHDPGSDVQGACFWIRRAASCVSGKLIEPVF